MLKKMQAVLRELGIPARPMPTQNVCEMFDTLRKDIVGLLSLRKHLEMKQKELSTLQNRYRSLTGETYEPVGIHPLKQAGMLIVHFLVQALIFLEQIWKLPYYRVDWAKWKRHKCR